MSTGQNTPDSNREQIEGLWLLALSLEERLDRLEERVTDLDATKVSHKTHNELQTQTMDTIDLLRWLTEQVKWLYHRAGESQQRD